jgi:hypothetical protein
VKHQFRGQQRESGKEREIWVQLGSKRVRERWDPNRRDKAWETCKKRRGRDKGVGGSQPASKHGRESV